MNNSPYKEFENVFFPVGMNLGTVNPVWWFDLDGTLTEFNLETSEETKHIQVSQPVRILAGSGKAWCIFDADGTWQIYGPQDRAVSQRVNLPVESGQHLAAAKLTADCRLALIYTYIDHSPARMVIHNPLADRGGLARRYLEFGYFRQVPLESDGDGNLLAMEGQPPRDVVKLSGKTLEVLQRYQGADDYLISIKRAGSWLFASTPATLLAWNYQTGELIDKIPELRVYSMDWSRKYGIVFFCTVFQIHLLDLKTGQFLSSVDKLPDLNEIKVSSDEEYLFLGRRARADERAHFDAETPEEIDRRADVLVEKYNRSREGLSIADLRKSRKIQIWRVPELIQQCREYSAE